ncbi:MAG: hypothetical protein ACE5E6_04570 [Phycisphaerae bacterium]
MARRSLRRYDVQARYAVILSAASAVPLLVAVALVVRNFEWDIRQVRYGHSLWLPLFLACVGVAILGGGVACLLGFNSADRRRNDKPRQSWIGFFLGGAVVCLGVILTIAWYMLKFQAA